MKKYFLSVNNSTIGPYSVNELRKMNIAPSTLVCCEGDENWKNANEFIELQTLFVPTAKRFIDQSNSYSKPRSTSVSQMDFSIKPAQKKPSSKIVLVIGLILVFAVGGASFYFYRHDQNKKMLEAQIENFMDSVAPLDSTKGANKFEKTEQEKIDSTEKALYYDYGKSLYAGVYDNIIGGVITITEAGNGLKINLKYNSKIGEKCSGEISGTGTAKERYHVVMTTTDGCEINLDFYAARAVSIEESKACKIYHGKTCKFDGQYYLREN